MSKVEKQKLRNQAKLRVKALSQAERAMASEAIICRIGSLPISGSLASVLIYSALPDEPGLSSLSEHLPLTLHFPTMSDGHIIPRPLGNSNKMRAGWRGISEPVTDMVTDIATLDAVLVPGRAFAPDGSRLGRGGGHYDAFLAALPASCWRIGIAFDCQVFPSLPQESHDIAMHWIITDQRSIMCSQLGMQALQNRCPA